MHFEFFWGPGFTIGALNISLYLDGVDIILLWC